MNPDKKRQVEQKLTAKRGSMVADVAALEIDTNTSTRTPMSRHRIGWDVEATDLRTGGQRLVNVDPSFDFQEYLWKAHRIDLDDAEVEEAEDELCDVIGAMVSLDARRILLEDIAEQRDIEAKRREARHRRAERWTVRRTDDTETILEGEGHRVEAVKRDGRWALKVYADRESGGELLKTHGNVTVDVLLRVIADPDWPTEVA